jgi:hypothetical protein
MTISRSLTLLILCLTTIRPVHSAEKVDDMDFLSEWKSQSGGFVEETEIVKQGDGAARFLLFNGNYAVREGVPGDWSEFDALSVWVYAEEAGEGVFGISVTTPKSPDEGWSYFYVKVPVDWEGWRQLIFHKEDFKGSRDPDWSNISNLQFALMWNGWTVEVPDASVVIDDIELLTPSDLESLEFGN